MRGIIRNTSFLWGDDDVGWIELWVKPALKKQNTVETSEEVKRSIKMFLES